MHLITQKLFGNSISELEISSKIWFFFQLRKGTGKSAAVSKVPSLSRVGVPSAIVVSTQGHDSLEITVTGLFGKLRKLLDIFRQKTAVFRNKSDEND